MPPLRRINRLNLAADSDDSEEIKDGDDVVTLSTVDSIPKEQLPPSRMSTDES